MNPCVVLDTETTGFPSNKAGFRPRIIEVGAVVVTEDARIVSPISFYVRQSRAHLTSWQAKRAMSVHGIGVDEVLRQGLDPDSAAPRFARWIGKVQARFGVTEVRAYNQPFDFWFLERSPWDFFDRTGLGRGEDIRETARRGMEASSGPSLAKAAAHADIPWASAAHRAGEDARVAARLAIHFESLTASR